MLRSNDLIKTNYNTHTIKQNQLLYTYIITNFMLCRILKKKHFIVLNCVYMSRHVLFYYALNNRMHSIELLCLARIICENYMNIPNMYKCTCKYT